MVPSINGARGAEGTVENGAPNGVSTEENIVAEKDLLPLSELCKGQQTNFMKERERELCEYNLEATEAIKKTFQTTKHSSDEQNEDNANDSVTMSEIVEDISAILNEIEKDNTTNMAHKVNTRKSVAERRSSELPKDIKEEVPHNAYEEMNENALANRNFDSKIGIIASEDVKFSVKTEHTEQTVDVDPDVMIIEVKHHYIITISDDEDKKIKPAKKYQKTNRQSASSKRPGLRTLQNNYNQQHSNNGIHPFNNGNSNPIMPLMDIIPVNINSNGQYESFTMEEQNLIKTRVRQGHHLFEAQAFVRRMRGRKKRKRPHYASNKQMSPAKRQKVNEVPTTNKNRNVSGNFQPKANNSINSMKSLPEKTTEVLTQTKDDSVNNNSVSTVHSDNIHTPNLKLSNCKSGSNVTFKPVEDSIKRRIGSLVRGQIPEKQAPQIAQAYEVQFKGLRQQKPPNSSKNVPKHSMVPQRDVKPLNVVSNKIKAPVTAQTRKTSNIPTISQVVAGPSTATICNNINESPPNIVDTINVERHLSNSEVLANCDHNSPSQSQSEQLTELYKIAIVHAQYPLQNLTEANIEEIKRSLLSEVDSIENFKACLGFLDCTYKNGRLLLTCNNEETKNWVFQIIENLKSFQWGSLKVIEESIQPKYLCQTYIPPTDLMSFGTLLLRLEKQNFGLSTKNWDIVKIESVPEGGKKIIFTIDALSKQKILAQSEKLFLNFCQINIKISGEAKDHTINHSADTIEI